MTLNIKDPIHGYIQLNKQEQTLLDSITLQRLREIKQLGNGHIVYPSATHTRFSHTLGVVATVQKYADSLDLDEKTTKELRMAALFHDTGHGPYSHLSEQYTGEDHEQLSCLKAKSHLADRDIDHQRVTKMIKGNLEIGQVLHGDVDSDRLDYLQRDSLYTGVDHGQLDTETIIQNAEINKRRLVYDEKAVPALENLLVARQHMTQSVYHHHASRIADKMMIEAFKDYTDKEDTIDLMNQTDKTLYDELKENYFYSRIQDRALYKRAYKITGLGQNKYQLKQELLEETGMEDHEILLDEYSPSPSNLNVKIKKDTGKITQLRDISNIVQNLGNSHKRIMVYSDGGQVNKIQEACEKLNL